MAKQRACKICKAIVTTGTKCPKCGSEELREGFKGKVFVIDPEQSEIAQKLNIKGKGEYAIRL